MTEHDRQERTDRLETTLHTIESLKQTGVLSVERAKGGVRETAYIVFLQGKAVEASAHGRTGQDAMDWVCTWGSCRYTFEIKFPSEIVVAPPLSSPTESSTPASPFGFISQVIQKYTHFTADGAQTDREAPSERSTGVLPPSFTPIPQTLPSAYLQTPDPQYAGPRTGPMSPRAPRRLLNGSDALSSMQRFGLSRLHRHVFFLLDGQRTTSDIMKLTGHSFYDIQYILMELEQLGLIRQEGAPIGEAANEM